MLLPRTSIGASFQSQVLPWSSIERTIGVSRATRRGIAQHVPDGVAGVRHDGRGALGSREDRHGTSLVACASAPARRPRHRDRLGPWTSGTGPATTPTARRPWWPPRSLEELQEVVAGADAGASPRVAALVHRRSPTPRASSCPSPALPDVGVGGGRRGVRDGHGRCRRGIRSGGCRARAARLGAGHPRLAAAHQRGRGRRDRHPRLGRRHRVAGRRGGRDRATSAPTASCARCAAVTPTSTAAWWRWARSASSPG